MKTITNLVSSICIVILLTTLKSCDETFVPDPQDSRLPKYTETGNKVAGALINDVAWKTNWFVSEAGANRCFYFTNYAQGDSIALHLDGIYTEGPSNDAPINFTFIIKTVTQLNNVDNVKLLTGQTFQLDGRDNYVNIDDRSEMINENVGAYLHGTGELTINNVKVIQSTTWTRDNGEKYNPLIVAGTFNFNFASPEIVVKSGRFDFVVNDAYVDQK
jgi:hypothetical protein